MATYVAVIRKTPGTDYWVDMPDIPGCVASGETSEAARENFRKAIADHLEGEKPSAPPRTLEQLSAEDLENSVGTFIIDI